MHAAQKLACTGTVENRSRCRHAAGTQRTSEIDMTTACNVWTNQAHSNSQRSGKSLQKPRGVTMYSKRLGPSLSMRLIANRFTRLSPRGTTSRARANHQPNNATRVLSSIAHLLSKPRFKRAAWPGIKTCANHSVAKPDKHIPCIALYLA